MRFEAGGGRGGGGAGRGRRRHTRAPLQNSQEPCYDCRGPDSAETLNPKLQPKKAGGGGLEDRKVWRIQDPLTGLRGSGPRALVSSLETLKPPDGLAPLEAMAVLPPLPGGGGLVVARRTRRKPEAQSPNPCVLHPEAWHHCARIMMLHVRCRRPGLKVQGLG